MPNLWVQMRLWSSLFTLLILSSARSQTCASAPTLQFQPGGDFKIVLFSDLHYDYPNQTCSDLTAEQKLYPCSNENTTEFMSEVIKEEKPDLIALLGDNIDWGSKNSSLSAQYAFHTVIESGIPWTVVLGNHDEQGTLNRSRVFKDYLTLPRNLASMGPSNIHGYGNYYLEIKGPKQQNFLLWFFDSGDWSKIHGVSGYDWIWPNQVNWFVENPKMKENGLAFFHIPLREYQEMINANITIMGDKYDVISAAEVNGGLFSALLESGVRATICGHDHINDFCGKYQGIYLCYNGGTSSHAYGREGWLRRTRIIQLQNYGEEIFTWKRLYAEELPVKDFQQF